VRRQTVLTMPKVEGTPPTGGDEPRKKIHWREMGLESPSGCSAWRSLSIS
jgi:hypothetical protein